MQVPLKKSNVIKNKVIYVVTNTTQPDIFKLISNELPEWDHVIININRWNRIEIEKKIENIDLSNYTISGYRIKNIVEILKKEKPDLIVSGNDIEIMNRLFIESANSFNIPTLLVQDGILISRREKIRETGNFKTKFKYYISIPIRFLRFCLEAKYSIHNKIEIIIFELLYNPIDKPGIYGHGKCLKVAVFGKTTKDLLISEGIDTERIVITGNPKFDHIPHHKNKEKVHRRLNIPMDKIIVLVITQNFVEEKDWTIQQRKDFIVAIAKANLALNNTQLIIKLHPSGEKEENYRQIFNDFPQQPIILKDVPLYELLDASKVIITISSTAAIEAMSFGKPVIIVDLFNDSGPKFFKNIGFTYVDNENDIQPALNSALYDSKVIEQMEKNTEQIIFNIIYLQDGHASKRIADLMQKMIVN